MWTSIRASECWITCNEGRSVVDWRFLHLEADVLAADLEAWRTPAYFGSSSRGEDGALGYAWPAKGLRPASVGVPFSCCRRSFLSTAWPFVSREWQPGVVRGVHMHLTGLMMGWWSSVSSLHDARIISNVQTTMTILEVVTAATYITRTPRRSMSQTSLVMNTDHNINNVTSI